MKEALIDILNKHGVQATELLVSDIENLYKGDKEPLETRKQKFIESLKPYVEDMGREEANNFYHYWTALKPRSRTMAFEREKSWNLEARIRTWMKNKKKFAISNMLKKN